MNKRQKSILSEIIVVIIITIIAVIGMINIKDWINRSEAMRAMGQLGQRVLQYRQQNGSLPPEMFITNIRDELEGNPRLGKVNYRAIWITLNAEPNYILAYSFKKYPTSLLEDGYVVLKLSGEIQWITKDKFEKELAAQQSPEEKMSGD